jgi:hypothetical protein
MWKRGMEGEGRKRRAAGKRDRLRMKMRRAGGELDELGKLGMDSGVCAQEPIASQ